MPRFHQCLAPHQDVRSGFLFLIFLLLLFGCAAPEVETEVTLTEALAFEPIGRGQRASLDTTEIAIRDARTWAAYQDSLQPLRPFRSVNIGQEMVLLAVVPVASGGYSIEFEAVEKVDSSLRALYLLSTPGYDCMETIGRAVVFQAVRVAASDLPVQFERRTEAYPCTPQ